MGGGGEPFGPGTDRDGGTVRIRHRLSTRVPDRVRPAVADLERESTGLRPLLARAAEMTFRPAPGRPIASAPGGRAPARADPIAAAWYSEGATASDPPSPHRPRAPRDARRSGPALTRRDRLGHSRPLGSHQCSSQTCGRFGPRRDRIAPGDSSLSVSSSLSRTASFEGVGEPSSDSSPARGRREPCQSRGDGIRDRPRGRPTAQRPRAARGRDVPATGEDRMNACRSGGDRPSLSEPGVSVSAVLCEGWPRPRGGRRFGSEGRGAGANRPPTAVAARAQMPNGSV